MIGQGPPTGREGGAAVQLPFAADVHPAYGRVRSVSVEVLVVLAGVVTYFGIRGQTAGSREGAIDHADDIVRLEQQLGLDHETQLQRYVIDSDALTTFLNWIYIWGTGRSSWRRCCGWPCATGRSTCGCATA
jgi:hypothetical protein